MFRDFLQPLVSMKLILKDGCLGSAPYEYVQVDL